MALQHTDTGTKLGSLQSTIQLQHQKVADLRSDLVKKGVLVYDSRTRDYSVADRTPETAPILQKYEAAAKQVENLSKRYDYQQQKLRSVEQVSGLKTDASGAYIIENANDQRKYDRLVQETGALNTIASQLRDASTGLQSALDTMKQYGMVTAQGIYGLTHQQQNQLIQLQSAEQQHNKLINDYNALASYTGTQKVLSPAEQVDLAFKKLSEIPGIDAIPGIGIVTSSARLSKTLEKGLEDTGIRSTLDKTGIVGSIVHGVADVPVGLAAMPEALVKAATVTVVDLPGTPARLAGTVSDLKTVATKDPIRFATSVLIPIAPGIGGTVSAAGKIASTTARTGIRAGKAGLGVAQKAATPLTKATARTLANTHIKYLELVQKMQSPAKTVAQTKKLAQASKQIAKLKEAERRAIQAGKIKKALEATPQKKLPETPVSTQTGVAKTGPRPYRKPKPSSKPLDLSKVKPKEIAGKTPVSKTPLETIDLTKATPSQLKDVAAAKSITKTVERVKRTMPEPYRPYRKPKPSSKPLDLSKVKPKEIVSESVSAQKIIDLSKYTPDKPGGAFPGSRPATAMEFMDRWRLDPSFRKKVSATTAQKRDITTAIRIAEKTKGLWDDGFIVKKIGTSGDGIPAYAVIPKQIIKPKPRTVTKRRSIRDRKSPDTSVARVVAKPKPKPDPKPTRKKAVGGKVVRPRVKKARPPGKAKANKTEVKVIDVNTLPDIKTIKRSDVITRAAGKPSPAQQAILVKVATKPVAEVIVKQVSEPIRAMKKRIAVTRPSEAVRRKQIWKTTQDIPKINKEITKINTLTEEMTSVESRLSNLAGQMKTANTPAAKTRIATDVSKTLASMKSIQGQIAGVCAALHVLVSPSWKPIFIDILKKMGEATQISNATMRLSNTANIPNLEKMLEKANVSTQDAQSMITNIVAEIATNIADTTTTTIQALEVITHAVTKQIQAPKLMTRVTGKIQTPKRPAPIPTIPKTPAKTKKPRIGYKLTKEQEEEQKKTRYILQITDLYVKNPILNFNEII